MEPLPLFPHFFKADVCCFETVKMSHFKAVRLRVDNKEDQQTLPKLKIKFTWKVLIFIANL